MDKGETNYLPSVYIKRYYIHAVIFIISLIVCLFAFYFFAERITMAKAEIYRYNNTVCEEAVIAEIDPKVGGDSFYALNGKVSFIGNNKRLFCDIYMLKKDTEYTEKNAILFSGEIEDGKCLISKNSAKEYGLRIGDKIRVDKSEIEYEIGGYLTPQVGLDTNYKYSGVLLLSYNEDLKAIPNINYANLTSRLDVYYGLKSSVFLDDLTEKAKKDLITGEIFTVVIYLVAVAVCEYFLFSPRYRDYVLMNNEGLPRFKLLIKICIDNAIKYVLQIIAVGLIYLIKYACYGVFYVVPVLQFIVLAIAVQFIYSYILLRRLTKCYKIRKA